MHTQTRKNMLKWTLGGASVLPPVTPSEIWFGNDGNGRWSVALDYRDVEVPWFEQDGTVRIGTGTRYYIPCFGLRDGMAMLQKLLASGARLRHPVPTAAEWKEGERPAPRYYD